MVGHGHIHRIHSGGCHHAAAHAQFAGNGLDLFARRFRQTHRLEHVAVVDQHERPGGKPTVAALEEQQWQRVALQPHILHSAEHDVVIASVHHVFIIAIDPGHDTVDDWIARRAGVPLHGVELAFARRGQRAANAFLIGREHVDAKAARCLAQHVEGARCLHRQKGHQRRVQRHRSERAHHHAQRLARSIQPCHDGHTCRVIAQHRAKLVAVDLALYVFHFQ
ncbi:hypothetical protein SDC9_91059 [bioreactor metagenome]|uniref:Uncharacterized protein n=1 Tax=bioreactor metagenome TaxID=1076179 RepID=A0A644ZWS5_9ZZZZ